MSTQQTQVSWVASRVEPHPPASLDVYAMVSRAVALSHQFRPEAVREARQLLNRAITQDPHYAPAWAHLGRLNTIDALFLLTGTWSAERVNAIIEQAEQAIALDPGLQTAHYTLAYAYGLAKRPQDALLAAQRCVQLGPSDADCLEILAFAQLVNGHVSKSQETIDRAVELFAGAAVLGRSNSCHHSLGEPGIRRSSAGR